tara:strand:+ start:35 stop:694 length:660 start_codon:yes stop_codon:yes gene_type:complete
MWNMRMHNKFGNPYFSDRPCPDCGSQLGDHNTNYNAGTGPIGPDGVKTKVFIKYCDEHYHQRARERMSNRHKNHLLNTAPAQEVIAFIQSRKSEFGQSKPMTKRTITKVEGERVPEGWVYIVRNPDVPSIVKIGKTFPDGIPDIMSSARRFGRAELVAKYEFKEAYKAEQSIHKRLERHNLRVLGYKDCGKELFQCDEMVAIFAILAEGPVLDDTEDVA